MDLLVSILKVTVWAVVIVVLLRVALSWLPRNWSARQPIRGLERVTFLATEPVLGRLRKVFKPIGTERVKFDVAPMIVLLLCQLLLLPVLS